MFGIGKVWRSKDPNQDLQPELPPTVARALAAVRRPAIADTPLDDLDSEGSDLRCTNRFVPLKVKTTLHATSARRLPGRIIDLSPTGVAIEADFRDIAPADIVAVGSRPVVLARLIKFGAAFTFEKPLDPKICIPTIVL